MDVQELLVLASGPGGAAPVPFRWRTWRSAGRRGSADRRGSAGRRDAESNTHCWPPRRRARQGERRPERETPTGGESGGRRGAGGPGGRAPEGLGWGRSRAGARATGFVAAGTGSRGGWGLSGGWEPANPKTLIYIHVFGPTCQRVCGFAGSGIKF